MFERLEDFIAHQSMSPRWMGSLSWRLSNWLAGCRWTLCAAAISPMLDRSIRISPIQLWPELQFCRPSALRFVQGNWPAKSCDVHHWRLDFGWLLVQWNRTGLSVCLDESIDRRHVDRWCLVRPTRLDRCCMWHVHYPWSRLYHSTPYRLVGNRQQSDASIDRMAAKREFQLHRNWNTKCPTMPKRLVPESR